MGQSASKDAKKAKTRRNTDAIPFAEDETNTLSLVNNNNSSLVLGPSARSTTNSFAGGGGDLASS